MGPSWLQYWVVYALSRLFLWPLPLAYLLEVSTFTRSLQDKRARTATLATATEPLATPQESHGLAVLS